MFVDIWGLARQIRDLVSETTGSVKWDGGRGVATVSVDGKTKEYLVKNGLVYSGAKFKTQVGYMQNDRIMLEEYDFNRDFNIAGKLSIYSYYDAYDEWIHTASGWVPPLGHAWLKYQNTNYTGIDVTLPNGQEAIGVTEFRVSTWNNGDSTALNRNWDKQHEGSSLTYSYSKKITTRQERVLLDTLANKSVTWTVENNCAIYARQVFHTVTGDNLGYALTPSNLIYSIQHK